MWNAAKSLHLLLSVTMVFGLLARHGTHARSVDQPLGYIFRPGQSFAYQMDLRWERDGGTEWFTGTPVFEVKGVNEKKAFELMVVGRLRAYAKPAKSDKNFAYPGRDVWLGTRIATDDRGERRTGRPDRNVAALPYRMSLLITPTKMLLPVLPHRSGDRIGHEGGAWLSESGVGSGPIAMPTFKMTNGREQDWTQATAEGNGIVRIHCERGFYTTEGAKLLWSYKGDSRFDTARGLIVELNATFETELDGKKATPVRITAKLLDGEELKKAIAKGEEDWKLIPAEHKPVEFLRQPVDLWLPAYLKTATDAKVGQVYAHLGSEYRYYVAEVIGIVDQHNVRLRYRGSKEELTVKVAELVVIPPDKMPPAADAKKP